MIYFTIDLASKSQNINSNSIIRVYKQKIVKIMENKIIDPKLTQKQIAQEMGSSYSTIRKIYRKHTSMTSQ